MDMSEDRHEVARLCENLTFLRQEAERRGLGARLDAIVAAAAAGRAEGITAFMRSVGAPESAEVRSPGGIVHPAATEFRFGVDVYGCPGEACDRSWIRPPGTPVEVCAVRGTALRLRPTA
ncbi:MULTISPECIES: hypothetical protein [unclassified Streptomyces]|uniref:hypothetical protein n=2 Tax=unclassified Streptomyces TaxID=2593676 RepID=UPI0035D54AB7